MLTFIARRMLRAVLTLSICVTAVFVVLRLAGDPTDILLPDDMPPEVKTEYRERWGIDRPIPEQYVRFLVAVTRGDLGVSFADGRAAAIVVAEAIPNTLLLAAAALGLALMIGIPLGVFAALKHNSALDRIVMSMAVLGLSIPTFFLGILLILLFALTLRWLPSSGTETWWHLIMPTLTLAAGLLGKIARFTRTAMLEVLGQSFVRTARAKGVPRLPVLLRHVFPNAAVPLLMFLGIEAGLLFAGAAVTETIFAWPGVGRLLVSSAGSRDLPVIQTAILFVAFVIIVSNLAVDIIHALIDPRLDALGTRGVA
ncbi:MAG: ABC transporter permease [Bosea sp.]|jgi:peptide/nickel transport system permease protein|nr:ABC transporter permease [Bosea sp. (in: a-proteobacteria)]